MQRRHDQQKGIEAEDNGEAEEEEMGSDNAGKEERGEGKGKGKAIDPLPDDNEFLTMAEAHELYFKLAQILTDTSDAMKPMEDYLVQLRKSI